MMTSPVRLAAMVAKAAPMITATARSRTLPLAMKALNSPIMTIVLPAVIESLRGSFYLNALWFQQGDFNDRQPPHFCTRAARRRQPCRLRIELGPDRRGECQRQVGRRPGRLSAPRRPHP